MNQLFRNITSQNYLELLNSFEKSKEIFWDEEKNRLYHPGEYGEYREDLLKKFLHLYVPERFGISSGFIITSKGDISKQCDVIIYDKTYTPKIQNIENQRFFPIETVLGVGEVKSTINSIGELNKYLQKLSLVKTLRKTIKDPVPYRRGGRAARNPNHKFDPNNIFSDNIFTFLLCHKLNFKIDINNIDYNGIDSKLWHNMVLSLKDGLICYQGKKTKNLYFSFIREKVLDNWFLQNEGKDLPTPIMVFLSGISYLINNTALLEINMEYYLTNNFSNGIE
jgi:hypothetical protein